MSAPAAPRKPLAIRALNRAGAALGAVGLPLGRLDPDALLAAASRRTGLGDFGDPGVRPGLERLVESLESEAALTLFGRLVARSDFARLLDNRLRVRREWTEHPEIASGRVDAPIFVLGLPRTGTTILHELLAQDPGNRVPMSWEAARPWPPPERASFETDPRIAETDRQLAGVDRLIPGFRSIHPMGARLPQECVALTSHDFASMLFTTTHRIPRYQAWLNAIDQRPVYASHRRWLQYLQWRCPAERWVLKSPGHLWALDALLAEYPDARIVQTHRDPLRVLASLVSLCTVLRSLASDAIDPREIGAEWASELAIGLERAMASRDAAALPPGRVFDLRFDEFLGNEIESIGRLYDRFGIPFSAEAERRMRRFLDAHPKDRHGEHRYALAPSGLDAAALRRRFARYVERHGVVEESLD